MLRFFDLGRLMAAGRNLLDSLETPCENVVFSPTYADVCVARALLKARGLPTELVLEILEWAEYEPVREFSSTEGQTASAHNRAVRSCLNAGVLTKNTLRDLKTASVSTKVKEIEFVISSRDQGWTSEGTDGTFQTSSWLEVSIVRPTGLYPSRALGGGVPPISGAQRPTDLQTMFARRGMTLVTRPEEAGWGIQNGEGHLAWYLQGNRVASRGRFSEYRVVWAVNHREGNEGAGDGLGFLEALGEGDRIVVWARAKYPGWQCVVESVKVNVRYSFTERDSAATA
ncbi:hypothetical protein K458DRAFT_476976 [Lentithecium fluviatile CBS 122367]|uniref:Uncharacterized protein n=1 Tax=Lentithecium fluviatile CBS 122367 TaxID=1168545 RepID=A0A6G1J5Y4_9PLEO|nr:hypothetical protein K458DRAFT_476976 [Lentithecium fluviatile CBS 122367]